MADKNNQISTEKIQAILSHFSLSPKDHLPQEELSAVIARLNGGPFDKDTFQQIWDQCQLNSKGEARLSQFMEYVLKAETILLENIKNTNIAISKLESQKPDQNDYSELQHYRQQLDSLYEEQQSLKISLNIIRKPFQQLISNKILSNEKANNPDEDPKQQLFEYNFSESATTLKKIIYLTLGLLMLTWLGSQMFNQFIDWTLCFVILMGYALNTISRKIVKFNIVILSFSFVYSIIWLILYTGPIWNPHKNYQYAFFTAGYLRFSIIMLIIAQIIKLVIIYFYLTQLYINQLETYSLLFCYKTILMQTEPTPNSQQHPLNYALIHIFNPKISTDNEPGQSNPEPLAH